MKEMYKAINLLFLTSIFNQAILKAPLIYLKSDLKKKSGDLHYFFVEFVILFFSSFSPFILIHFKNFTQGKKTLIAILLMLSVSCYFVGYNSGLFIFFVFMQAFSSFFHGICSEYALSASKIFFKDYKKSAKKMLMFLRIFEKLGNIPIFVLNAVNAIPKGKYSFKNNILFSAIISVLASISISMIYFFDFKISEKNKKLVARNNLKAVNSGIKPLFAPLLVIIGCYHTFNNFHFFSQSILLNKNKFQFSKLKIAGSLVELLFLIIQFYKIRLPSTVMLFLSLSIQIMVCLFYYFKNDFFSFYYLIATFEILQRISVSLFTLGTQNLFTTFFSQIYSPKTCYLCYYFISGASFLYNYLLSLAILYFFPNKVTDYLILTKSIYFGLTFTHFLGIMSAIYLHFKYSKLNKNVAF